MLGGAGALVFLATTAIGLAGLLQESWFREWFFTQALLRNWKSTEDPPAEPRVPYVAAQPEPDPRSLQRPADLFVPSRIWTVRLKFSSNGWQSIQPKSVPRSRGWLRADGTLLLSNTNAPRPGLAGVLGFAQPWSHADLAFGDLPFTNVAVRFKGNGTFISSENRYHSPYKIDLSKLPPKRAFVGQTELNLHNLVADHSCLADTLGYEFFRDAGLPAPRTTFARLFLTIDGRWSDRILGLYLLVEDPSESWLAESLGHPGGALFKPVTLELFSDLGDAWEPYVPIYNPKSEVSDAQRRRLVELSRLVTHADDAEFARRIFDYVDLDALCRFVACEALLANYDGIFTNGQNFLLWLDASTGKFGFAPWDLDHSWGEFEHFGSREDKVRADVLHPWAGRHRFFERVFAVPAFDARYRAELRRILDTLFVPERLHGRIDTLAAAIRPAVAGLPEQRVHAFEHAVGGKTPPPSNAEPGKPPGGNAYALKPFIERRAASVRDQLEGRATGVRIRLAPEQRK